MNCNADAFAWIIDFVRIKTDGDEIIELMKANSDYPSLIAMEKVNDQTETAIYDKLDEVDNKNCLNIMVTVFFLKLRWVYTKVWDYYFCRNFHEIINDCKISLSNINPAIVRDIANRINDESLELLTERKDKFISNVYKARIEQ
jgi:hypothetical protein